MIQLSDVNTENAANALKELLVAASKPPGQTATSYSFGLLFYLGDIYHSRAREVSARTSRSKSSGGPMPCSSRSSGRRTRSFFVAGPFSLLQPKGSGFGVVLAVRPLLTETSGTAEGKVCPGSTPPSASSCCLVPHFRILSTQQALPQATSRASTGCAT